MQRLHTAQCLDLMGFRIYEETKNNSIRNTAPMLPASIEFLCTVYQASAAEDAQIQTPRLRQLHNGLKGDTQREFSLVLFFYKTRSIPCCLFGSVTKDLQIYKLGWDFQLNDGAGMLNTQPFTEPEQKPPL